MATEQSTPSIEATTEGGHVRSNTVAEWRWSLVRRVKQAFDSDE